METPDSEREKQEGSGCPSIASCVSLTRDAGIAGSSAMDKQQFLYLYRVVKGSFLNADEKVMRSTATTEQSALNSNSKLSV